MRTIVLLSIHLYLRTDEDPFFKHFMPQRAAFKTRLFAIEISFIFK